jgi:HlyD family secretion protein
MKIRLLIAIAAVIITGCRNKTEEADAYGNFEATEVIISAETSGRILKFDMEEGSPVEKGEMMAQVDTILLHLQKAEIDAGINSVRTRIGTINAQDAIFRQQIANLNVDIARVRNMLKDDAATQKQFDDMTGQVEVLNKQIEANNTQKSSVAAELAVYGSKKATLNEQILRACIRSPLNGTLIEKYSEAGEETAPGKPVAKIADLSVIKLKVYVSGGQLDKVRTGAKCTVRIDNGAKGYRNFSGIISYVSDKAEFTPKIIQTKKERVAFVYAVTINVINDGTLKSGMPGEAIF